MGSVPLFKRLFTAIPAHPNLLQGDDLPLTFQWETQMSCFSHRSLFGTPGSCKPQSQLSFPLWMTNNTYALGPIPSFLSHTNLFISISMPVCYRISCLYKRKPHGKSSFDSITIPGYFTFQLQSRSPQALPILVSPFSPVIFSSTHSHWSSPTSICFVKNVGELEAACPGWTLFLSPWPLTSFGHARLSLRLKTLCSPGFCDPLTLPTSLVDRLISSTHSFSLYNLLTVEHCKAQCGALFPLSVCPWKSYWLHGFSTAYPLIKTWAV